MLGHSLPVCAQRPNPKGFHASLGAGVAIKNNIRKDNLEDNNDQDPIIVPIPFVSFGWGPVQLKGQGLEGTLYNHPLVAFSLTFSRFGDAYKGEDMARRKQGFFAGANLRLYKLTVSWKKDIDKDSEGSVLDLAWSQGLPPLFNNRVFPNLRFGAEYWDQKLISYYYGVRADEVRPDRPFYNPSADWAYFVGLNFMIKITERISTIVGPNYKNYGKNIDASPTTVKNDEFSFFLATFYSF